MFMSADMATELALEMRVAHVENALRDIPHSRRPKEALSVTDLFGYKSSKFQG